MRRTLWKSYEIVLQTDTDEAPISLESVRDADEATLAFHTQFQRLKREGTTGELLVLNSSPNNQCFKGNPVLRLPLG